MANKHDLHIEACTTSFLHLLGYALPYSLSYVLLVYFLTILGFQLDIFLLVLFTIFILSFVTTTVFYKRQHRLLQPTECNRMALLSAILLLIMAIVFMTQFFGGLEFTWSELSMVGFQSFIAIAGVLFLIVNYILIFFSLWLIQRYWRR
ncbi:MAG: ABZJ_00895 family protein [Psychrobacter sp.]|uniref:ABZJ_00895 family protein n=1 Tax=Psychrobacter sp. AOP7-B1-24 TaxID=3457645 RepID=UPI003FBA642B